jgi:hypothetical protein
MFELLAALVELIPDEAVLWLAAKFILPLQELWNRAVGALQ